ncbi:Nucleotidyltransferase domain-containing protein [Dyadobacter sp. SG02]|uniref:nucleotidyltransferase domain-containing protein n=1 Tax=Dyadobacter sp. SG02 TaxID=1855291 RepID=UPI0008C73469|nr:nucleotidyltransferase domain-containing protein [Dyadobacter sp. SG02]SEI66260.1 Nucleotidyltransferase domain-containing protein [Dyadobacter sp. SG02]
MSDRKVPESIAKLTEEFVAGIRTLYGERLDKVILFGSYARGEQHEESDVDFLVVLNDERINAFAEISRMSGISAELGLKYSFWISTVPISINRLLQGEVALAINVRKEGIVV